MQSFKDVIAIEAPGKGWSSVKWEPQVPPTIVSAASTVYSVATNDLFDSISRRPSTPYTSSSICINRAASERPSSPRWVAGVRKREIPLGWRQPATSRIPSLIPTRRVNTPRASELASRKSLTSAPERPSWLPQSQPKEIKRPGDRRQPASPTIGKDGIVYRNPFFNGALRRRRFQHQSPTFDAPEAPPNVSQDPEVHPPAETRAETSPSHQEPEKDQDHNREQLGRTGQTPEANAHQEPRDRRPQWQKRKLHSQSSSVFQGQSSPDIKGPTHKLRYPELIRQRLLIWLVLIGLNAMCVILALKTAHHAWVLTLILYMKSKDVTSCIISIIWLTGRAIHDWSRPPEEIPPKWILTCISAYSESEEQIIKTLTSIRDQSLGEHRQVLVIVLDGKPRNIGSHMSNVICSFQRPYTTWKFAHNEMTITAGFLGSLPMICLEKAQNAGKKDSLILCHDMFSVMRENVPPANKAMREDIWSNIIPRLIDAPDFKSFDMVFMTDADTTVHQGAMRHLAKALAHDKHAIAACGVLFAEMRVGAEWSLWHLFQQYQYTFGQYIRRRAEGYWGKVTCLPGCITMCAVRPEMAGAIQRYAAPVMDTSVLRHQVQYLGTDRRLTYCMLAEDKALRTIFVPYATCETVAPQTLRHYLSQRRRWGSNSYFNNYFYCMGANQAWFTRFWGLVDIVRTTLVYYRVANTIMFLHDLVRHFALIKIIPLLVVTQTPTVWYLLMVFFQEPILRKRAHKLVLGLIINKIISPILSIIVFTGVLRHVGSQVWGQTGTSTKVTCGPLGTLDADAPKAAKKLAKVFPAYMAEKLGHNRPESVYRREECSIAWMA